MCRARDSLREAVEQIVTRSQKLRSGQVIHCEPLRVCIRTTARGIARVGRRCPAVHGDVNAGALGQSLIQPDEQAGGHIHEG